MIEDAFQTDLVVLKRSSQFEDGLLRKEGDRGPGEAVELELNLNVFP